MSRLSLTVAAALAVTLAGCSTGGAHPSGLAGELAQLRAGNGLYLRPSLTDTSSPDLAASAYAFAVQAMAGRSPASPWSDPQAREAASRALSTNSVWGSWYVATIDQATGTGESAPDLSSVVDSLQPSGYFADQPANAPDTASRLAATTAALQVIDQGHGAMTATQRKAISSWLTSVSRSLDNPYQACNVVTAAAAVDGQLPTATVTAVAERWWQQHVVAGAGLASDEDTMDAYGYACVRKATGSGSAEATRLRTFLSPYLRRPADPVAAFHLARAWTLAGGAASALGPLADAMAGREAGPSHLVSATVQTVGTMTSAYAVERIRAEAGLSQKDGALAAATRAAVGKERSSLDGPDLVLVATTLRLSGHPDGGLETAARQAFSVGAPAYVDESNIGTWAAVLPMLATLHAPLPAPTLHPWKVSDALSRYSAWMALGLPGATGASARSAFGPLLAQTPALLADQAGQLSVKELDAAVTALVDAGDAAKVPTAAVNAALSGLRGCERFPLLYRPAGQATDCDLGATQEALEVGHLVGAASTVRAAGS